MLRFQTFSNLFMFRGLLLGSHTLDVKISDKSQTPWCPCTCWVLEVCAIWYLGTKRGADPTFASAKVKNAIGRIAIFDIGFFLHSWRVRTNNYKLIKIDFHFQLVRLSYFL